MVKILTYDLETAPKLANVWGVWNQNIPPKMLLEDGYIMSWAARWYGEEEIMSDALINYGNHLKSEGAVAASLYKLLDEADILVSYNGDRFDRKVANTAFAEQGWDPVSPSKSIDLFKVVKKHFKFTSNKLDFVAQKLGVGKKLEHEGFELWRKCMEGDPEAWANMIKYNKQDIEVTEALYDYLKGWIHNHPNVNLYNPDGVKEQACPNCGSTKIKKNGTETLVAGTYQRYKCCDCGANMRDKTFTNTKADRDKLMKGVK